MAADNFKTWFINGRVYVTPRDAADFLGLHYEDVLKLITGGDLPAVRIEARQLIELDILQAYAASDRPLPRKPGRGALVEEWI